MRWSLKEHRVEKNEKNMEKVFREREKKMENTWWERQTEKSEGDYSPSLIIFVF